MVRILRVRPLRAMRHLAALLALIFLIGCAHPKPASHRPVPTRSLESFGSFDSIKTVEELIARVGLADMEVNTSGSSSLVYILADQSAVFVSTIGRSRISSIKHGQKLLYADH